MSVKARSEITLTSIADVKGVYRYYLLQSSTLQAPDKPTVYPPPEIWDDTEPIYQGGTNSLYTVDVTVLSDDTFFYSNVSLSSSYEAAKAAWNKADNAENMAANADKMYIGPEPPEDVSKIWCDTSITPPVIKRWNGESWDVVNDQSGVIDQLRTETTSQIDKQIDAIRFVVGEKTYTTAEFAQLVADQYSEFLQTKNRFEMNFSNFQTDINDLSSSTDARFMERDSYIWFENDPTYGATIYIGMRDSPFILRLRNDRISFLQNGSEVAYISNRMLFITDAKIINTLWIGNFRWVVEANGSLSLD